MRACRVASKAYGVREEQSALPGMCQQRALHRPDCWHPGIKRCSPPVAACDLESPVD
jgi:hypothetical protein